jgi:hypothetical protein
MNSIVAGIDLRDRESLATVLSPVGDVADRFTAEKLYILIWSLSDLLKG